MKHFRLLLSAIVLLMLSSIVNAQTADEIIQKHITAIGGVDNWKKVTTMKINGVLSSQGVEMPVIITTVQGKGQRAEFTFNGMTGYQIITPSAGWTFIPFAGQTKPEAIPDALVKESQDELDLAGPLVDYQAKGNKVTYLGKDEVEGTECHKLKLVCASGKEQTVFIDASNYYHIRTVEKSKANGQESESTSNFGNFQKLPEGIVVPMSLTQEDGPITVKSIEINKPVDENIFKPTEPKK